MRACSVTCGVLRNRAFADMARARDRIDTRVDLHMMIACENGRERSLEELVALLGAAGFRYRRAFTFLTLGVIEAEAA